VLCLLAASASAAPRPLAKLRVEGDSKVTEGTALRLAHIELGDPIDEPLLPVLEAALVSSNLFKSVALRLDGDVLVATLDDKLSWVVAPTLYILPSSYSFGAGFVENNLFGEEKKLLLYGQYGNQTSLFFGTYFDPAVRGTQLQLRLDVYLVHRSIIEYDDYEILRDTKWNFIDAGVLVGWRWLWWLVGDLRFKPAYTFYSDIESRPEKDGWDVTLQSRLTLDRRKNRRGVTWGPYAQVISDVSIPGLDDYGYQVLAARAYYSFKFFEEHQLELRVSGGIGRHLPLHEELTIGGVADIRGYVTDQFRGDRRGMARAEYSVPVAKYRMFAFRALGFYERAYVGFHWRDPESRRYLPTQHDGASWTRSDVGAGFRIYVNSVVLPLLGLDVAYGLEGKRREVVFEVGITDF